MINTIEICPSIYAYGLARAIALEIEKENGDLVVIDSNHLWVSADSLGKFIRKYMEEHSFD
jgi:hypothetical protein